MMKTKVIIVCLALIFSGMQVFAQLSKAEKKEWKKKAKEYSKNPAELKSLIESKQAAETEANSIKGQVSTLNSQISDKNAKISDLEDQISKMRGDLTSTRAELAQLKENPPAPVVNPMDFSTGVVFKVQIGAFKSLKCRSVLLKIKTSQNTLITTPTLEVKQLTKESRDILSVSFAITGKLINSKNTCAKWA